LASLNDGPRPALGGFPKNEKKKHIFDEYDDNDNAANHLFEKNNEMAKGIGKFVFRPADLEIARKVEKGGGGSRSVTCMKYSWSKISS